MLEAPWIAAAERYGTAYMYGFTYGCGYDDYDCYDEEEEEFEEEYEEEE